MRVTHMVKDTLNMARDRLSGGSAHMSATDLLEMQHRELDLLFARIKRATGQARRSLVEELAGKLAAHMAIEQEIFYPACRRRTDQGERVLESYEEHRIAAIALDRLLETDPSESTFEPRLKVLRDLFRHHVTQEEDDLFHAAEQQIERQRLETLGDEMRARFNELLQQGYRSVITVARRSAGAETATRPPPRLGAAARGAEATRVAMGSSTPTVAARTTGKTRARAAAKRPTTRSTRTGR